MTQTLQDMLWDVLESEACEQYYIDEAEKPAFFILHKFNPLSRGGFELYMNHLSLIGRFRTIKRAREKLTEAMSKATKPLTFFRVDKFGRKRGIRELFAKADGKGTLELIGKAKIKEASG